MYIRRMQKNHISSVWNSLFVVLSGLVSLNMFAQSSQIVSSLVDPSRSDRVISLDVRVPVGGMESLPWIVFGHGFFMNTADYDVLSATLNEAGMAVVMVDMETGLFPSHEDFGLDLAFTVEHAAAEAVGLEGLLGDRMALMGHSMGGGAAWLAASQLGASIDALVGLAPAETSPSAIDAGSVILASTMVISGSADGVTSPEEHHIPLHEALVSSTCRSFVEVLDGGHCGFADAGTSCDLGELFFAGMSRDEFQAHAFEMVVLWLRAHLMDDISALDAMQSYDLSEDAVEVSLICELSEVPTVVNTIEVWPNPTSEALFFSGLTADDVVTAFDLQGRKLALDWQRIDALDVSRWPQGMVVIQIQSNDDGWVGTEHILIH